MDVLILTAVDLWMDACYPGFFKKISSDSWCLVHRHKEPEKSPGALLGVHQGLVSLQGFMYWGLPTSHKQICHEYHMPCGG